MSELLQRRAGARAMGLRVVQCHGCFDIVHPGHIRHLRQAKSHADILLVTITGDKAWTKRQGAPLIPEELRAENLAELDCVDWVYIEQRPTALELLDAVQPDVYVKGKEYEHNNDPRFAAERSCVERHGGRVVFSSGDVVFSSTALISAMERSIDPYHARLTQLLQRPNLDGARLSGLIGSFRGQRLLVVGETIIDTYTLCDQPDVASESPVMTLRPLEQRQYDGGAAIIARHAAALGARPVLLTALPASSQRDELTKRLRAESVEVLGITINQPLAEKQRFLVGQQKVMKVNNLRPIVLDAHASDELVALAGAAGDGYDAAIVADFGNGLLSPALVERLSTVLRPRVRVLTGDVSGRRGALTSFRNFDLLAPSESEAREALRCFDESLPVVAWRLLQATGAHNTFITLGGDGLVAFEPLADAAASDADEYRSRVRGEHVPALSGYPVDPLGCGDALLTSATLALASGADLLAAGVLGSLAAACEAQRLGNIPINAADLRHAIVRLHSASLTFAPAQGDRPRIGQIPAQLA
jgi:rfaE bifunctional protein nucleotidyltransferase chain/domain